MRPHLLLFALAPALILPGAYVLVTALNIEQHLSISFPANLSHIQEPIEYPVGSSLRYAFQVTSGGPLTLEILDEHALIGAQQGSHHDNLNSETGRTGTLHFVIPSPARFYLFITHGNGSEVNPADQTFTLHKYPPVNLASLAPGAGLVVSRAAVAALVARRAGPANPR